MDKSDANLTKAFSENFNQVGILVSNQKLLFFLWFWLLYNLYKMWIIVMERVKNLQSGCLNPNFKKIIENIHWIWNNLTLNLFQVFSQWYRHQDAAYSGETVNMPEKNWLIPSTSLSLRMIHPPSHQRSKYFFNVTLCNVSIFIWHWHQRI